MNLDQLLREANPSPHAKRGADELRPQVLARFVDPASSLTASPADRTPRFSRAFIAGAAAAVLGIGGVAAYASGVLEPDVKGNFTEAEVSDIHELASFKTPDGAGSRSFQVWSGATPDGRNCIAVLEAASPAGPDWSGNCGDHPTDAWFNTVSEGYVGDINDTPPPPTYYAYGEPAIAGVVNVRVFGAGFDHRVPLNPTTGGFAVALPEVTTASGTFATVEFLAVDGQVLGTRKLIEKVK